MAEYDKERIEMSTDKNEKEIVFRMAQSLLNEIKVREKGMTDVRPFAERYNFLREKVIFLPLPWIQVIFLSK